MSASDPKRTFRKAEASVQIVTNKLWACPLQVERGTNQEMPESWLGACVVFYVGAITHEAALEKAVTVLRHKGMIFVDLLDGKVIQLDPTQWWEGHVLAQYPEYAQHFPSQEEVLRIVREGLVFHGPFAGWDRA